MDASLAAVAAAYEGLEDPAAFADRDALERYRADALARSSDQARMLAERLPPAATVLEIGSGNGRLLVELARRGAIAAGLGVDVAGSRVAFAQAWAGELGLETVRFEAQDALGLDVEAGSCDAAVCITGALSYFGAAEGRPDRQLLDTMALATRPGGVLCLEVYPHPALRRLLAETGGEARTWQELAPSDPWRFYLSHHTLDGSVLTHEKTFVHRHTGEIDEGRRERLYLYEPAELVSLMQAAGCRSVELHEGWTDQRYAGGELLVAIGRR